jgi:hypothetical protein
MLVVARGCGQSGAVTDCELGPTKGGLAQTLLLNVCDAAKAQFGQIAPRPPACPFGTLQTPHIGVCASLNGMADG